MNWTELTSTGIRYRLRSHQDEKGFCQEYEFQYAYRNFLVGKKYWKPACICKGFQEGFNHTLSLFNHKLNFTQWKKLLLGEV